MHLEGYTFTDGRAAMARGIFGAGSGFRVGWRTAGGLWFPLALGGQLSFWGEGWALSYHSLGFGHFPSIS